MFTAKDRKNREEIYREHYGCYMKFCQERSGVAEIAGINLAGAGD